MTQYRASIGNHTAWSSRAPWPIRVPRAGRRITNHVASVSGSPEYRGDERVPHGYYTLLAVKFLTPGKAACGDIIIVLRTVLYYEA